MGISVGRDLGGVDSLHEHGGSQVPDVDDILFSINQAFDQVHLAADFLLLKEEPENFGPDQQLACLIKDRMARLEQQVSELYRRLRHRNEAPPPLDH